VTPPGENGGAPELAVDAAGNALAVYLTTSVTPSTTAVAGTRRAADGGTWAAPVPLGELDGVASARPDLAVDGDGNALATWDQGDGSNLRARARALDVAGPVLSSAVVPDTVQAGAPVQLAVAPLDVWGQLAGDPTWSFGDGSLPATGRSVSHTWANPGSYGVSVSASDAFGNVRVHTRMLTVVASPGAPAEPELTPLVSSLRVGRVGRRMHATLALPPGVSVTCRLDRMGFVVRGIRVSTAYLPLRQVCRRGAAGTVTLRLGALRPGLYRLRVVATSTDGRTAVVQRGFRVRRARSA
jgi:hypothetical protein